VLKKVLPRELLSRSMVCVRAFKTCLAGCNVSSSLQSLGLPVTVIFISRFFSCAAFTRVGLFQSRPVVTGGRDSGTASPNFVGSRKFCFKHTTKSLSGLKSIGPQP